MSKVLWSISIGDPQGHVAFANRLIAEWLETDQGKWAISDGRQVTYSIKETSIEWGLSVIAVANLSPEDEVYYDLRWGNGKD